ncbi:MAG: 4Fe-4S cluster-binding domain-containing protein [Candidatus Cloacimonetes bacterium]|nr:4Fe-4S cluster-binding domain-containing protein [Candidatus Cloacimonadota bacterium]
MLQVLSRLLLYKAYYYFGFPRIMPMSYTISLTWDCNSKCSTCFVCKRKSTDMSLDEYKKVFYHLGKSPYWITFSGGEPFLRKDFTEIVKSFYDICKPRIINIPTNGILTNTIIKSIQDICQHCKKAQIIVNLSIDGIGDQHDQIRNVPGNYQKVILTFDKLKKMCKATNNNTDKPLYSRIDRSKNIDRKKQQTGNIKSSLKYKSKGNNFVYQASIKDKNSNKINEDAANNISFKNLSVGIHTVISKYNIDNFAMISNTLMELKPEQYITEIAEERHELMTVGVDITPELLNYKAAVDYLTHRIKHTDIEKRMNRITQAFRIEYYKLAKAILRFKTQIIPCYSGVVSCQIAPDGDVWACCIKAKSLGNLRKNKYNLKKILRNIKFKKERKYIKDKQCYCPLANASYTNMLLDFKTLFRVFYRSFVKWFN